MDTMGIAFIGSIRYYRIRQFGFDYLIPWLGNDTPSYEECSKAISDYFQYGENNAAGIKRFKH